MSDVILLLSNMKDKEKIISIGNSIIDYFNIDNKYKDLFVYTDFLGNKRTALMDISLYNEISTLIPNFELMINSDNINEFMRIKNIKFISDINLIFFILSEEEALYIKMKNEELFDSLIDSVMPYSGNILDYL